MRQRCSIDSFAFSGYEPIGYEPTGPVFVLIGNEPIGPGFDIGRMISNEMIEERNKGYKAARGNTRKERIAERAFGKVWQVLQNNISHCRRCVYS